MTAQGGVKEDGNSQTLYIGRLEKYQPSKNLPSPRVKHPSHHVAQGYERTKRPLQPCDLQSTHAPRKRHYV